MIKNEPQEARDVGMAGLTPEEYGIWVRQERVMHLREQREMSARLAEAMAVCKAVDKLEAEEVGPDMAV